jgi:GTP cyclohydrolase FolE2
VAVFIGIQPACKPYSHFELYKLLIDLPGHSKGATVSRMTLAEHGHEMPEREAARALETPAKAHET